MSTTHRLGCNCGNCVRPAPPKAPPMRIGDRGDTIDSDGVRRKANGDLRNCKIEVVLGRLYLGFIAFVCIAFIVAGSQ